MELREALAQITEIRAQIAQNETFRGYRSLTVGLTGLAALLGACAQAIWIPSPQDHLAAYLALWIGIAALGLAVNGLEIAVRSYWHAGPVARQATRLAVEQFAPSVAAGGLLSAAIVFEAPEYMRMLPGLWSIVFGLGIFASCRLLPSPTFWLAVYYLVGGVAILAFVRGDAAFSPWIMAGTFGVGQSLAAAILYFTLERRHDKT